MKNDPADFWITCFMFFALFLMAGLAIIGVGAIAKKAVLNDGGNNNFGHISNAIDRAWDQDMGRNKGKRH